MDRLKPALMTVVWHTILERFNATSLSLQKVDIDLISAVTLCDSLVTFLLQLRGRFDETEEKALAFSLHMLKSRNTKKQRSALSDVSGSLTSPVHQIYRTNCTRSVPCWCFLSHRGLSRSRYGTSQASGCIFCGAQLFGFLTEFESLTPEDWRKHADHLVESYPEDLEPAFVDEFVQFTDIFQTTTKQSVTWVTPEGGWRRNAVYFSQCCYRSANISDTSHKQLWRREIILNTNTFELWRAISGTPWARSD